MRRSLCQGWRTCTRCVVQESSTETSRARTSFLLEPWLPRLPILGCQGGVLTKTTVPGGLMSPPGWWELEGILIRSMSSIPSNIGGLYALPLTDRIVDLLVFPLVAAFCACPCLRSTKTRQGYMKCELAILPTGVYWRTKYAGITKNASWDIWVICTVLELCCWRLFQAEDQFQILIQNAASGIE